MICREYTKTPTSVPNVNFKYGIVHIGKDGVMTLKNTKTNIPQSIQIKKVRGNSIFAHCTTCHSAQGSSIDGDITIFDYITILTLEIIGSCYGQQLQEQEI